jgi:hypothetical protein
VAGSGAYAPWSTVVKFCTYLPYDSKISIAAVARVQNMCSHPTNMLGAEFNLCDVYKSA